MKRKPNPFPMEAIFPGIHAERPDIAAADAEAFLAYGHKMHGFDPLDKETREQFIDCATEKFSRFKVKPTPELQRRLDDLPEDWEHRPEFNPQAEAIADSATAFYRLPPHLMCILMEREIWITKR